MKKSFKCSCTKLASVWWPSLMTTCLKYISSGYSDTYTPKPLPGEGQRKVSSMYTVYPITVLNIITTIASGGKSTYTTVAFSVGYSMYHSYNHADESIWLFA